MLKIPACGSLDHANGQVVFRRGRGVLIHGPGANDQPANFFQLGNKIRPLLMPFLNPVIQRGKFILAIDIGEIFLSVVKLQKISLPAAFGKHGGGHCLPAGGIFQNRG